MIRRSPTRIELKLDDIQEFDYVQKYDKKKTTTPAGDNGTNLSSTGTAKLLRHDRIGLPRPGGGGSRSGLCLSANCSGDSTTTQVQPSSSSTLAVTALSGVTATSTPLPAPIGNTSEVGADTTETEPESNVDPPSLPSGIEPSDSNDMDLIDFNSTYASANMSMDET